MHTGPTAHRAKYQGLARLRRCRYAPDRIASSTGKRCQHGREFDALGYISATCNPFAASARNVDLTAAESSLGVEGHSAVQRSRSATKFCMASTTNAVMGSSLQGHDFELVVELAGDKAMESGGVLGGGLVHEGVPRLLVAKIGIASNPQSTEEVSVAAC